MRIKTKYGAILLVADEDDGHQYGERRILLTEFSGGQVCRYWSCTVVTCRGQPVWVNWRAEIRDKCLLTKRRR